MSLAASQTPDFVGPTGHPGLAGSASHPLPRRLALDLCGRRRFGDHRLGRVPPAGRGLRWLAGVVLGLFTVVVGELMRRRHRLHDQVVEAVGPLMGTRALDRRTVTLARWTLGWPGTPRIVRIRYAPGAQDNDPAWLINVQETLRRRLLCDYRVRTADPRRCRLILVAAAPAEADRSLTQLRVERTIGELIGPTAKVRTIDVGRRDRRTAPD